MKHLLIIILLQIILSAQSSTLKPIKLQLQWKYQFQFAGFIMAKELGYYKDVGLDVEILEYKNEDSLNQLQKQQIDYTLINSTIAYEDKKLYDATLIATYLQRSPLIIITQPNIKSVLDLTGKKIMISEEDHFNSSLTMLLNYFNITCKNSSFIKPTYNIDDFIEKKVDASTAFRSNELFILNKKNIPYNIIDPVEHGFITNANNLFTSQKKIKNSPQEIEDFLNATKKGWEYALNNIETASKIIQRKYQPNRSLEHIIFEGKVTKEIMLLTMYEIGEINKEFVLRKYMQLIKEGKLNKEEKSDKLILKNSKLLKLIKQKYIQKAQYDMTLIVSIFFILIIIIILFWLYRIRQEVQKRSVIQDAYKGQRDLNELYLDTAQVMIVALDTQAKVTMLNKKGEELLGYTEKELLGKVWFDIGVLPKNIEKEIKIFFANLMNIDTLSSSSVEHALINRAGNEIMLSFRSSLLFDKEKNVIGILSSATDITQLLETQELLKHQAQHDALTGLPNRVLFVDRLDQAIKKAARYNQKIAVFFIDLDHFKGVNDSLGHNAGDILLKTVASRLQNSIRKSDTVARVGGDEFTIILDDFNHVDTITSVVQNIMRSLKEAITLVDQELYVTLSLGIAIYPENGEDSNTLIKNADAAMYKAKHNGRNNYQFYTQDMTELAYKRIILETELRQSLIKNQMEVYYQIQIDSTLNSIVGMEALLRWNHPSITFISPTIFIPLAEEIGFITELDEWVMKEALLQFKTWKEEGLFPGILSLNLAVPRLEKDDFINRTKEIFSATRTSSTCISFEITESQIMKNPEKSIEKLHELKKLGIALSIDDFGTGYSSLSYLKKLPISKLKIDKSFITDIPNDSDDIEITKTIISMAKNLNLSIIAEGVETQEQSDFLQEQGCKEIQGYFYHKPAPAGVVEQLLREKQEY